MEQIAYATDLRSQMYKKQIQLICKKIIDAAKNFKLYVYIQSDFKFDEKCIEYFKNLGYKIKVTYSTNTIPYKYSYEIDWR